MNTYEISRFCFIGNLNINIIVFAFIFLPHFSLGGGVGVNNKYHKEMPVFHLSAFNLSTTDDRNVFWRKQPVYL